MQEVKEVKKDFQLTVGELRKIYNQMKIAIDENKDHLDCIYFNRIDGELVTTDGMQMLIYRYKSIALEKATEDDNLLLFSSVIKDILKKNKNDDDVVGFIKNDRSGCYKVAINDCVYNNNEDDYSFPKYKAIIGDSNNIGVLNLNCNVFDFSQFKDKIINFCEKAISLKASSYRLEMYCEDSTKLYLVYNADGCFVYDTIILKEKQNINFCFDIRRFLNAIKDNKKKNNKKKDNKKKDNIESLCGFDKMYYSDKKNPVLAKKDDVLYVLMPIANVDTDCKGGVLEEVKNFVKDKNGNNIEKQFLKFKTQENRIILQKDFDLQQTGYWAPSANFIKNYEKARKFFKVKDTMEEICNKRKLRKEFRYRRYDDFFAKIKRERNSKFNDIKEKKIFSGEGIKQYDYVWFKNSLDYSQRIILRSIYDKKIKNLTEISIMMQEHYKKIISIYKEQKYLNRDEKQFIDDFENKLSSLAIKENEEKQEIEHKQDEEPQTQEHEHEHEQKQEQQADIEKKVIFCNCYFTRAKYNEKNKRFQNETGRFDKIQYTIKNGCLSIYRSRTGELLEHSIKADDLVYNKEKKKWIYTRKREGERRLRIDFDKNIFDLINGKPERTKKGVLIEFATQAIKKIREVAMRKVAMF